MSKTFHARPAYRSDAYERERPKLDALKKEIRRENEAKSRRQRAREQAEVEAAALMGILVRFR